VLFATLDIDAYSEIWYVEARPTIVDSANHHLAGPSVRAGHFEDEAAVPFFFQTHGSASPVEQYGILLGSEFDNKRLAFDFAAPRTRQVIVGRLAAAGYARKKPRHSNHKDVSDEKPVQQGEVYT